MHPTALEPCPGCRALLVPMHGPIHRYMASSPACWAAFGDVLARGFGDPACFDVHRLGVDAYAVQHPGAPSRRSIQSVGVHLVRLCLALEHGLAPDRANQAMLLAAQAKAGFHWLDPPSSLGRVTVADVLQAADVEAHRHAMRAWACAAWEAWAPHHPTVRRWAAALSG